MCLSNPKRVERCQEELQYHLEEKNVFDRKNMLDKIISHTGAQAYSNI